VGDIGVMLSAIEKGKWLLTHYLVICLFLALLILTLVGVGNVVLVSLLGILLCLVGLVQHAVKVDLWVLGSLLIYNLFSMIASYRTFGNTVDGYAAVQMIFPVIYLLLASLSQQELVLLRRLCVVWVGMAAVIGMLHFVYGAVWLGSAKRLGGLLGNPNGFGIFLVLGWFALQSCTLSGTAEAGDGKKSFLSMEPLLLTALGLTLSLGSFAAMAVGVLVLLLQIWQQSSRREMLLRGCVPLAKLTLGVGMGLLLYLGAARTNYPWVCLLVFAYVIFAAYYWRRFEDFLQSYPRWSLSIAACGLLVAGAAVAIRPSAMATFAERLAMMQNGIHYLSMHPLWGVGPYQWRVLNLYDNDIYFNTNHIHNAFIHVGVEMGLVAGAVLLIIAIRGLVKKRQSWMLAGCVAFFFHCLIDTGFFYLGIVTLVLLTVAEPGHGGRYLSARAVKGVFGLLELVFLCNLICYVCMI
jgi:O-antigen ligase